MTRPARTTYFDAQAVDANQERDGRPGELTAIEPHPNDVLRRDFPGLARLVMARAQDIPLTEFTGLQAGDILFIDSSHVVKIGACGRVGCGRWWSS